MFEYMDAPSIDQVLHAFGRDDSIARHPATSRRSADTRKRLLAYLATDAARVLLPDERVLLTAERQFAPDGAFTRVFGPDVLVAALPGFLGAGWLPRHVYDARAQVRFVELLCDWIVAHGLVDAAEMSGVIYGVLDSARAARAALGTASRELDPPHGDASPPRSSRPPASSADQEEAAAPTLPGLEHGGRPDAPGRGAGAGHGACASGGAGSGPGEEGECATPRRHGHSRSAG